MAWITAQQALGTLGVKPQTLYASVSRGRIRAKPDPKDSRRSLYNGDDVRRLSGRRSGRRTVAAVAADTIGWGDPVLPSSISTVADGRLWYRGKDAVALSQTATLEQVAALLWQVPEAGLSFDAMLGPPQARQRGRGLPLFDALMALAARAGSDPPSRGRSRSVLTTEAGEIVGLLAGAMLGGGESSQRVLGRGRVSAEKRVPARDRPAALDRPRARAQPPALDRPPLHERMALAWISRGSTRASKSARVRECADLLRRALVLLADHELNASTFAARVAISTGAPLSASLLAALATLSGPLHGGASAGAQALAEAARRTNPHQAVREWLAQGIVLPAFGHPLYPEGDPRAIALLGSFKPHKTYVELCRVVESTTGEYPNSDFAIAALADALDLPRTAPLVMFATARSVGWTAHALEQLANGDLIRPRARYTGPPVVTAAPATV